MGVFKSQARASSVAQRVKDLPEMREIWVWSLGWEDLLEEEMAAWESWEVSPWPLLSSCCCPAPVLLQWRDQKCRLSRFWEGRSNEVEHWVMLAKMQKYLCAWVARFLASISFLGEREKLSGHQWAVSPSLLCEFFNQKICLDLPGG